MADVAQWTADQFWKQLEWVAAKGRSQKAQLAAQKLALQTAYTAARNAGDQATMTALEPLIHKNSELRVRYQDLASAYNDIVEKARAWLGEHGIQEPPVLAGLGVLPAAAIVPALWVAGLVAVAAIVYEIDQGIRAVNKGMEQLGPVGKTAISLVPLALVAAAILFLLPNLRRATT
jgi:hypothetical protein